MVTAKEKNTTRDSSLGNQVEELYEIMRAEKLEELELEEANVHIHLKRKTRKANVVPAPMAQAMYSPEVVAPSPAEPVAKEQLGDTITSPIMGVFYRAAAPSSPPFSSVGDVVKPGKTLCIIEAMKVMNEIKADSKVKIVKILVENGTPVSADQDIFVIEKV